MKGVQMSTKSIAALTVTAALVIFNEPICQFFDTLPTLVNLLAIFGGFVAVVLAMLKHEAKEAGF